LPALPGSDASAGLSEKDLKKQQKEAEKAEKKRAEDLKKINKERKKQGLEPLAELPREGAPSSEATAALPPVPGSESAAPLPGTESAPLPGMEAAPLPVAEAAAAGETPAPAKPKKVAKKAIKKWTPPDFGPNVIFGGLVRTKGGTIEEKLAWVSQHVLNGMDFNGYQVQKEEGVYAGQTEDGQEWRQFTFVPRKKKATAPTVIYVAPAKGDHVWLRVGPPEPPAGVPASEVKKMRLENQQVMSIMKKQMGGALRPVTKGAEAPYRRTNG